MPKSIRTVALAAVLSLVAAPTMHAERFGTNPHPDPINPVPVKTSAMQTLAYAIFIYLGV